MSVWRKGPLTENPYVRNAFRVARLEREVVRRLSVAQRIAEARGVVERDPTAHTIAGVPVTLEEINRAESVLLTPERRILEELLVHAGEHRPVKALRQLAAKCAAEMAAGAAAAMPPDLPFMRAAAEGLARRHLAELPAGEPSLGALELELVPPFGQLEEET